MKINPSVVCELVGDDVVVLDSGNSAVVTLTGDSAKVVKRLLAGESVSATEPGVDELLSQGIILSTSPNGLSRRSLVTTGAAAGAGGIFAMTLPAAANSSSTTQVTEPEVTEPEPLDAPQFRALDADLDDWGPPEQWGFNEWEDVTNWDSSEAYIRVKYIANFDQTLDYEFRFSDSEDTFFPLTYVEGPINPDFKALLFSWDPDPRPDGFTGNSPQAFLRAINADGLVSDETPFLFVQED